MPLTVIVFVGCRLYASASEWCMGVVIKFIICCRRCIIYIFKKMNLHGAPPPPNFMGPCKKLNRKNIFWLSPPFRDSKTMLHALMMTFYPSTIKCFISSVVHVGMMVAFWKPIYLHVPYQPPNTKTFLYQSISLVPKKKYLHILYEEQCTNVTHLTPCSKHFSIRIDHYLHI